MMRAVFMGDGTLLAQCAERFLRRGGTIAAVVTGAPVVADWARVSGLTVVEPGRDLAERLAGREFEWFFSVANLRIIPEAVLNLASKGAVNFHDGPLPDYAGLNAPVWALWNNETEHAITWHRIEGGVDEGRILVQRPVPIVPEDTAFSLNAKCYAAGIEGFDALLPLLESGADGSAQDPGARRYFGRNEANTALGLLDWTEGQATLLRRIRALDHGGYWNPLAVPKLVTSDGQVLAVGEAEAAETTGDAGAVLAAEDGLVVGTGDGSLRLRGLTDLFGGPVAPQTVEQVVATPDKGDTLALQRAARAEGHWRTALSQFVPSPAAILPTEAGQRQSKAVDVAGDPVTVAAKIAAMLLACSGRDDVHVGLAHGRWSDLPELLSRWVPFAITGTKIDQLERVISQMAERGPFAADIALRDPEISPRRPEILISLGETDVDAALTFTIAGDRIVVSASGGEGTETALRVYADRLTQLFGLGDQAVTGAALLGEFERQMLLETWNDTAQDFDATPIHALITAQAQRTPDAEALVFERSRLTFAELEARANALANVLVEEGVEPGHMVGLNLPRSLDLVVGALAIWQAGAAYVPLDPDYPADRIAHYLDDSGAPLVLTTHSLARDLPDGNARHLLVDRDPRLAAASTTAPGIAVDANQPAYVIYTSGSTGTPKGVVVSHRNVANFFVGMDDRVPDPSGGTWLAVTSLSFDISVLELFWTLARGFRTVVLGDENKASVASVPRASMGFSLYFWGNDDTRGGGKYDLLLEAADFADDNGFTAIWTPERHFHAFGGPFPNPSVTGAAVAGRTKRLGVRAGSCVAPLHHPARIAEEWAVIDNLTGGRAGLAFASGWQPDDFILRPENTPPANKPALTQSIETVRKLWRGEAVAFPKADGTKHEVITQPRPVQPELPIWITTAGNPETWIEAGRLGANVLTHLLGQTVEEVGEKIKLYRSARAEAGHDPASGEVTLMLHTYLANSREEAQEIARAPMRDYLKSAAGLIKQYAWAFPAFKKPAGAESALDIDLASLSDDEMDGVLDFAFERYFETSGLFGTVDDAMARVAEVKAIGVDEIACLIDYGIATEVVLEGLRPLADVVGAYQNDSDTSLAGQIDHYDVTHFQCTPSMARLILMNDEARAALGQVPNLMLGGEPLPGALAEELMSLGGSHLENMYGPTETTIWSSTRTAEPCTGTVDIGTPIANTTLYVLNAALEPVPLAAEGELVIGGEGVTLGYHNRDALTAERFPSNPFGDGRLYRTGDLVRRRADGRIDFLGRTDNQVKLRGFRIELGEVDATLEALEGIEESVSIVREDIPGDRRLVSYVRGARANDNGLRSEVAARLPAHMVPGRIVAMERFPLTPNKKVDRARLPVPATNVPKPKLVAKPPAQAPVQGRGLADVTAAITEVWEATLGLTGLSAEDHFFDLGGHSLLAVQAHRDLKAKLGAADLSITDIFRFPRLGDLAARLSNGSAAQSKPKAAAHGPQGAGAPNRRDAMARRRAMRAARAQR